MAEQKNLPPNRAETDFPDWYDGKKINEVAFAGSSCQNTP